MVVVTTLSYDELSTLIRDKRVALNNDSLILPQNYEAIQQYIEDRLGSDGFVMAITTRIDQQSVDVLSVLDQGLHGERVILEAPVDRDDLLVFDSAALRKVPEFIERGFSEDTVMQKLGEAERELNEEEVQVVCTPCIKKTGRVRVTSPYREVDLSATGITFVKLNGGQV